MVWMDYDKTWWMTCVGDKDKPIRFWFRSGFRSGLSVKYKTETVQPSGGIRSTEWSTSWTWDCQHTLAMNTPPEWVVLTVTMDKF